MGDQRIPTKAKVVNISKDVDQIPKSYKTAADRSKNYLLSKVLWAAQTVNRTIIYYSSTVQNESQSLPL